MAIKTQTKTGSTERVIRTIFQVLLACIPAAPAIVYELHLSLAQTAQALGYIGLFVVIISTVHNGLEAAGLLPAMLRSQQWPSDPTTTQIAQATAVAPKLVADAAIAQSVAGSLAPVVSAVEGSSANTTPTS